jgi:hypothetical protein
MIATTMPLAAELDLPTDEPAEGRASRKLPPSERDFGIFEMTVIDGDPTRAAALLYKLSQTRVVQIAREVTEWMAENLPATPRLSVGQRLAVAREIAQRRLDGLYSVAMSAWHKSQGELTTQHRRGVSGTESTVTREYFGDPRYLAMAMRIVERTVLREEANCRADEERSRVRESKSQEPENRGGESEIRERETSVSCPQAPAEARQRVADASRTPENPPVEDCSAPRSVSPKRAPAETESRATSGGEHELSDQQRQRRKDFFGAAPTPFGDCSAGATVGMAGEERRGQKSPADASG